MNAPTNFRAYISALLLVLTSCLGNVSAAEATGTGQLLKLLGSGNHFVLLRHAMAPGTADPAHFDLNDCKTQRNLNEVGREQARKIGKRLRDAGINRARVYSSQWCRCLETAQLMAIGSVNELPALNSFYETQENQDRQTQKLRFWLSDMALDRPVILVTHQVNITALVGVYPNSGELIVVKRLPNTKLQVAGTIKTAVE